MTERFLHTCFWDFCENNNISRSLKSFFFLNSFLLTLDPETRLRHKNPQRSGANWKERRFLPRILSGRSLVAVASSDSFHLLLMCGDLHLITGKIPSIIWVGEDQLQRTLQGFPSNSCQTFIGESPQQHCWQNILPSVSFWLIRVTRLPRVPINTPPARGRRGQIPRRLDWNRLQTRTTSKDAKYLNAASPEAPKPCWECFWLAVLKSRAEPPAHTHLSQYHMDY